MSWSSGASYHSATWAPWTDSTDSTVSSPFGISYPNGGRTVTYTEISAQCRLDPPACLRTRALADRILQLADPLRHQLQEDPLWSSLGDVDAHSPVWQTNPTRRGNVEGAAACKLI